MLRAVLRGGDLLIGKLWLRAVLGEWRPADRQVGAVSGFEGCSPADWQVGAEMFWGC